MKEPSGKNILVDKKVPPSSKGEMQEKPRNQFFLLPELSSLFSSMLVSFDAVFKKLFTASCAPSYLVACFIIQNKTCIQFNFEHLESPCFSAGVFWHVQPLWRMRPRPPDSSRWSRSSRTWKSRSSCFGRLVAATDIHSYLIVLHKMLYKVHTGKIDSKSCNCRI